MSVFWSDGWKRLSDGEVERFGAACLGRAQDLLERGPCLFNRVEVGRVRWQVQQLCPALLDALASNLVDNALRYTHEEGRVTVRVRRIGNQAELSVEDNGPGIPAEALERVLVVPWNDRFTGEDVDYIADGICEAVRQLQKESAYAR